MKIVFSEIAEDELADAIRFYELEFPGLGLRFKKEVKKALIRIREYPLAWPIEKGEILRYIMHKFPYKILFSIENELILIIAIAHLHRKPNYWIDRKKN